MKRIERINIKEYVNDDYIYIGRPSIFGNPFTSKDSKIAKYKVGTKKEAIEKYREYILENIHLLDELIEEIEYSGFNKIGCFCKINTSCHGDVLIELIKERTTKSIF